MRVWLVDDDKNGEAPSAPKALLRQLEDRPGGALQLVGFSPFHADFTVAMNKLLPDLLDIIVLNERACPDVCWSPSVLGLGPGLVVIVSADRVERLRPLAETQPLWLVPPDAGPETLWLALVGALNGKRCQAAWKDQLDHLQRRLDDRIIIERAKGILIQRLDITEEDAYRRLRMLSRRQRRQIRDIAQSLLDTQCLLMPEVNGDAEALNGETPHGRDDGPSNA